MKTLKSIMLGLALLITGGAAKAATNNDGGYLTRNYAVNAYVETMTQGKSQNFDEVVDKSAKFNTLRGNSVLSFTKAEVVESLKETKNISQDCITSTSVIQSNDDLSVVKVDMQYDGFTRSNYVTISNTGNGWKITNVYSVFK